MVVIALMASPALASDGGGKKKAKKKAKMERKLKCDPKDCDPSNCDPKNCDPKNCDPKNCNFEEGVKEEKCAATCSGN